MTHAMLTHISRRCMKTSSQRLVPLRFYSGIQRRTRATRQPGEQLPLVTTSIPGVNETPSKGKYPSTHPRTSITKRKSSPSAKSPEAQQKIRNQALLTSLESSYLQREQEIMRQWTPLSLTEISGVLGECHEGILSKEDMNSHLIVGFRVLYLQHLRMKLSIHAADSADKRDFAYLSGRLPSKARRTLVGYDPSTLVAMELWNKAHIAHHGRPLESFMCVPSFTWERFAGASYSSLDIEKRGVWAGSSSQSVMQSISREIAVEFTELEHTAVETIAREARRLLIFLSLQNQLLRYQLRDPIALRLLDFYLKGPTTRVWLQYVKHPYFVYAFTKWNSWANSEKGKDICSMDIVSTMPGRLASQVFVDKLEVHLEWDRYNARREHSLVHMKHKLGSDYVKDYDEWWLHQLSRRKSDGNPLTTDELRDLAHLEESVQERRSPQGTLGSRPDGRRQASGKMSSQTEHNLSQMQAFDGENLKLEARQRTKVSEAENHYISGTLQHGPRDTVGRVLEPIHRLHESKNDVPNLAHGLDRVLFNPGVHWLQDPHSGVFNFAHSLQKIPPVESFAFEKLPDFTRSSADDEMHELAKKHGKSFTASTSSTTSILAHIYYLISGRRQVDTSIFSKRFSSMSADFTRGMKAPGSISLVYKDGIYSVDSLDPFPDSSNKNILTWLGRVMERQLTLPSDVFGNLIRTASPTDTNSGDIPLDDSYQYSKTERFILRSQLDCVDPRLPGTGVFDIKTRACVAIRLDRLNYEAASTYLIRSQYGEFESFEREYYDMIRSSMIKYNFQVRIGHMDGIFVAYHNTARIFGFQYLSLDEMDRRLFGNHLGGDRVFSRCLRLYEKLIQEIASIYPGESVKCLFRTSGGRLKVWVQRSSANGENSNEPLIELTLKSTNIVNGKPRREGQFSDFEAKDITWDIAYEISQCSSADVPSVRADFERAQQQQLEIHKYVLPEGVDDIEEMRSRWDSIDFGGNGTPSIDDDKWSDVQKFFLRRPFPIINTTRELAKKGKKELEEQDLEEGTRKVEWAPGK